MTLAQRFEAKTIPEPNSGCILWTASVDAYGYGQIKLPLPHDILSARKEKAHRVAFWLARGRWPALHVLHRCDVRSCVNPDHLREGTNAENVADRKARRGR